VWGPAAASVLSGQNATLALLLIVIAGSALARGRGDLRASVVAGICASLLAYKPQFAAPLLGIAVVRWRPFVLAVTGAGLLVHYLVSVIAAGGNWAWPMDWASTLSRYSDVDLQTVGWSAVSISSVFARIQLPGWTDSAPAGFQGLAVVGYVIGGLIALACLPALRSLPWPRAIALACALVVIVMPHAWIHNATLLLPALAVLASDAVKRGWPWQDRWLFAMAYAIGLSWPIGYALGVSGMPFLALLMPLLLLRWNPQSQLRGALVGARQGASG
jgi:hypothetical protein